MNLEKRSRAVPEWEKLKKNLPDIWLCVQEKKEFAYLNEKHKKLFGKDLDDRYVNMMLDKKEEYSRGYIANPPTESGEKIEMMAKVKAVRDAQEKMYFDYHHMKKEKYDLLRIFGPDYEDMEGYYEA